MEQILSLNQVTYCYEGARKEILQNVSIEFAPGKLYAIMGKSGAGKSTLLSLLAGLDLCAKGEIYYNGKNMRDLDRDKYRAQNAGVIFQGYNLLINATALENIILSMNISGVRCAHKKGEALSRLSKVGIDAETARRKILKLSGGEQQRVGIARALSHHPDIIIADEPTGNLDGGTEETVMRILQGLAHHENKCVIIVTHSRSVSNYADELWGLNQGRLSFIT